MTRSRSAVLEVVEKSEVPLSASEVFKSIEISLDLATVYRSLIYFEDRGLMESFSFTCSEKRTERYYYHRREPHEHFFHCEGCHRFIDLGECRIDDLLSGMEKDYGVHIHTHTLYFTGLCGACSAVRVKQ